MWNDLPPSLRTLLAVVVLMANMKRALEEAMKAIGGVLLALGIIALLLSPVIGLTLIVIGLLFGVAGHSRQKERQHQEIARLPRW